MRYRWVILFVVLVAAGGIGNAVIGSEDVAADERPPAEQLLRPSEAESFVWPYTSRSHNTDQRTLALNVVIVGSPEEVRAALRDRSELEWEETEGDRGVDENVTLLGNESAENATTPENATPTGNATPAGNATSPGNATAPENATPAENTTSPESETPRENGTFANLTLGENVTISSWNPARGAARYTYVADNASSGRWVESEYQLATGTYLGSRTHIRAYPGPADNWTALQAHTEYWDWFRLRHTVTGVSEGARVVERDLRDEPFVDDVSRVYHGHRGGGSDGWMTVIELSPAIRTSPPASIGPTGIPPVGAAGIAPAAALLAVAASPLRGRVTLRDLVLPVAMIALVLGVRTVGITLENLFPAVNPKIFAAMLYPVLVGGPPLVAAQLVHRRSTRHAGMLAAVGLGAGFVLDLGGLGVNVVPIDLVVQRTALVGAIGLFTYGLARQERWIVGTGLAVWIFVLAASLLGLM